MNQAYNEYRIDYINYLYEGESFFCKAESVERALDCFKTMMEETEESFLDGVAVWEKVGMFNTKDFVK